MKISALVTEFINMLKQNKTAELTKSQIDRVTMDLITDLIQEKVILTQSQFYRE